MIRAAYIVVLSMLAVCAMWSLAAHADDEALVETRYCGVENIRRDADGSIHRRSDVLRAFRAMYACPSTRLHSGSCPGWQMDHPIPLARGGCDAVSNIQWLPIEIKTCRVWYCKDRWELTVYQGANQ